MTRSVLAELKSLSSKSFVYSLGGVIMRGMGFFLLPLITRYVTRADYGILAITGIVSQILTIVYPLGLPGAVQRFYFSAEDEDDRLRTSGTIWMVMILVALAATLLLDRFGGFVFPLFFESVSFDPFIRLAIWTSFFNAITLLALIFFQVQERPTPYVITVVLSALLSYGLLIAFVVFEKQGALSYLRGSFIKNALLTVPYVILTVRNVKVALRWDVAKSALAFGLPLVPHALATWVLEFADRAILERFVSLDELGLYSMGYTFGSLMSLIGISVNNAWAPFLYRTVEQQGKAATRTLTRLVTYYVLGLCAIALGQALFIKDLIAFFTAPAFHAAYRVAPWIIGGQLFTSLYYIPANFLLLKKKTRLLPLVTVLAGAANVGLNLWLAPHYGIMAAAWVTFLCYGLMLILAWGIALRVYPLPYEYRRLGTIALVALGLFVAGNVLPSTSVVFGLIAKGVLLLLFPLALAMLGFFSPAEKETIRSLAQQALVRLRRTGRN